MRAHLVRSSSAASPADEAGDERLVALIRDEIAAGGPVTFARFMERALYEPELGYYAVSAERPTATGDFVTAPELHPVFGWTLARQLDQMWRHMGAPEPFVVREFGAGSGALIESVFDGLVRAGSQLADVVLYDPIDLPRQRASIAARLDTADRGHQLVDREQAADLDPITGVVIANEFLDALPVHRVVQQDGTLRELYVDWKGGQFAEVAGDPSSDQIRTWFLDAGVTLADGHQAEVNLGLADWVELLDAELERGYVVVIDYGTDSADLYGPTRPTGTLRAFAGQHVSSDVLHGVGRRDITAHVDFGALERSARAAGFDFVGRRRLNEFLIAAGLDDAYAAARAESDADWDSALLLRGAVRRLVDPAALGGYQVAVFARGVPANEPLSGFAPLPGRSVAH